MRVAAAVLVVALVGGCAAEPTVESRSADPGADSGAESPAGTATAPATTAPERPPSARRPLAGRVVVIDPGHQLGNRNFPSQIARRVPAGGFRKPCNTTGTSTDGGYPEATFVWQVSHGVVRGLERLGATVVLTRRTNSERRWGPCVDVRGRAGNRAGADLELSIHADGSYAAGARGFHVIAPPDRRPWTHDIHRSSLRLAQTARRELRSAGFPYATYVAGGDGLDIRGDLATLNLSDVPTVMVELGNMRSADDARVMLRASGRARYAAALVRAIRVTLR